MSLQRLFPSAWLNELVDLDIVTVTTTRLLVHGAYDVAQHAAAPCGQPSATYLALHCLIFPTPVKLPLLGHLFASTKQQVHAPDQLATRLPVLPSPNPKSPMPRHASNASRTLQSQLNERVHPRYIQPPKPPSISAALRSPTRAERAPSPFPRSLRRRRRHPTTPRWQRASELHSKAETKRSTRGQGDQRPMAQQIVRSRGGSIAISVVRPSCRD